MNMYVTYLTTYSGNKLPPFYIGSSSINHINNGYRGSVQSKQYGIIWKEELKTNPHLFKTVIISTHDTREEALQKELILQTKLNVVRSPMYINMALAQKDGYFGISTKGRTHTDISKERMSIAHKGISTGPKSEEHRRKLSIAAQGRVLSDTQKSKLADSRRGKKHTPETIEKMRLAALGKKPSDRRKPSIREK